MKGTAIIPHLDHRLQIAVIQQNPRDVEQLLKAGVDANLCTRDKTIETNHDYRLYSNLPPLYIATILGNFDIVHMLLKSSVDVNAVSDDLCPTSLSIAIYYNHIRIVELLLQYNANVEHRNRYNKSVLHDLCDGHALQDCTTFQQKRMVVHIREQMLRLVVEHTQNASDPLDHIGLTPLWYAIAANQASMVRILIGAMANTNFIFQGKKRQFLDGGYIDTGMSILQYAVLRFSDWTHFHDQDPDVIIKLLENGANVHFKDADGDTALQVSVITNKTLSVFQLLLEYDADVNTVNKIGNTPLHTVCTTQEACRHGAIDGCFLFMLFQLLKNGANQSAINNDGKTPRILVQQAVTFIDKTKKREKEEDDRYALKISDMTYEEIENMEPEDEETHDSDEEDELWVHQRDQYGPYKQDFRHEMFNKFALNLFTHLDLIVESLSRRGIAWPYSSYSHRIDFDNVIEQCKIEVRDSFKDEDEKERFDEEIWFLEPEEERPGWDERSQGSNLEDDPSDARSELSTDAEEEHHGEEEHHWVWGQEHD
jgi:ankyrin repeat protein